MTHRWGGGGISQGGGCKQEGGESANKGLIKPEPQSAPLLRRAFFKGNEVTTTTTVRLRFGKVPQTKLPLSRLFCVKVNELQ